MGTVCVNNKMVSVNWEGVTRWSIWMLLFQRKSWIYVLNKKCPWNGLWFIYCTYLYFMGIWKVILVVCVHRLCSGHCAQICKLKKKKWLTQQYQECMPIMCYANQTLPKDGFLWCSPSHCIQRYNYYMVVFPGLTPLHGTVATELFLCQVLYVEAANLLMYW